MMMMKEQPKFVLPEDMILKLEALAQQEEEPRWEVGGISAELIDVYGKEFGKKNVRKAIAVAHGCATATVRDREGMSRFYPQEVREEFEVLTYHQLRACKAAGPDHWREYAEWAIESADDFGGRPAPVDAIRAKLKGKSRDDPAWKRYVMRIADLCESLLEEEEPEEMEEEWAIAKGSCSEWLKKMEKVVEKLSRPAE